VPATKPVEAPPITERCDALEEPLPHDLDDVGMDQSIDALLESLPEVNPALGMVEQQAAHSSSPTDSAALDSSVLQHVPSEHMSLLRADLKLTAGQRAEYSDLDAAVTNFSRFAETALGGFSAQPIQAEEKYSLHWCFQDDGSEPAAQRAAKSAQALLATVEVFNFQEGSEYQLHMAVSTGLVQIESPLAQNPAQGQAADTIKNITQLVPSNSVYLCQHTVACIDGELPTELVGQVHQEGLDEAFAVYQLQMPDAVTLETDATPAVLPLVGRDHQLELLRTQLQNSIEHANGAWLMVNGVPGIGKTRLLEEFHNTAAEHRAESFWYTVGSDRQAPRAGLLQALSQRLVLKRNPGLELEQVHQRLVGELILSAEDSALLAAMLGIPHQHSGEEFRADLQCDMLVRLLNHRRSSPGFVLVIEDMHWASTSMKKLLSLLCDRLQDQPALMVFSSRDDMQDTVDTFSGELSGEHCILEGLAETDALALSSNYLPVHTQIVRQCISRASGNPLYLIQQLQAAVDTIEMNAPSSLRGIVHAKLLSLSPSALEQLQTAAVLGSRFSVGSWSGVLGYLPNAFDTLIQKQLIKADSSGGYIFAHDLMHSVVYRSIDQDKRRALHLKAALYFEANAELSAWHFLRSENPLSGVPQLLLAGSAALAQGEQERAAEFLGALSAVDESQLPQESRFQLHRLRADVHKFSAAYTQARNSYHQALLLAESDADKASTKLLLAECAQQDGDVEEAMHSLGTVLAEARSGSIATLEIQALMQRAALLQSAGRCAEAESDLRAAQVVSAESDVDTHTIEIAQRLGELLCVQANFRTAEQLLSDAHQQRERQRHGSGWADRDPWLGQCLYFMGDVCGARDILQAAVTHAQSIGDKMAMLLARCLLGPILLDLGEPASALNNGKRAMEIEESANSEELNPLAMVTVGESHIRLGKYALGLQMLTRAWSAAESSKAKYTAGPWALASLATVVQRDVEQRNLLSKGEHLLHSGASGVSHLWFYRMAVQVALGSGDEALARRYAKLLQDVDNGQELPWVKQACAGLQEPTQPTLQIAPLV